MQDLSARPPVGRRAIADGGRSDDIFVKHSAYTRPVDNFLVPRRAVRRAEVSNRRWIELLGGWEIHPDLKELDARPSLVARFPEPVWKSNFTAPRNVVSVTASARWRGGSLVDVHTGL